jgi:DNA-binding transcriptional LysR family regulator
MSYTKAAEELHITQPGVSQHIKQLENFYDAKLFSYNNKTLELTAAGKELKNAMLSIKHDNLHLKEKIVEKSLGTKTIKFGATLTIGEFFLPIRLINYLKKNPSVNPEFYIANTQELLAKLDDGVIDFAFVEGYFHKSEYEFITIKKENYIAVCGQDYPIGTITHFSDLFSHNLLIREGGSGTKEVLERYLDENGYSVADFLSSATISNINVIKQMLENNYGISFIYEIAVEKELSKGILKQIHIPNFTLSHEFNFIWRKNSIFQDYYKELFHSITDI